MKKQISMWNIKWKVTIGFDTTLPSRFTEIQQIKFWGSESDWNEINLIKNGEKIKFKNRLIPVPPEVSTLSLVGMIS